MAGSLQDQLLNAGLADADKAKKLKREKRKAQKHARSTGQSLVDDTKVAAAQALAEKAARARGLNQERDSKAQRKAINAQIRQLIEVNKLARGDGDISFNFTDGRKIKQLRVSALQHKQLAGGVLSVVKQGDAYEVVPRPVANKIAERDASRVIDVKESADDSLTDEEKDWYKDYEIPDDLMW